MNFNLPEVNTYIKPTDDDSVIRAMILESGKENFDQLTPLQKISLFELNNKFTPTNNIILFIELQQDGTGDYGWIKEYIKLFNSAGYNNENIYIIPLFQFHFNFEFIDPCKKFISNNFFYELLGMFNSRVIFSTNEKNKFSESVNKDFNELYQSINQIHKYLNFMNESIINSEVSDNKKMLKNADDFINNPAELSPFYEKLLKIVEKILENNQEMVKLNEICDERNEPKLIECKIINSGIFVQLSQLFTEFLRFLKIFKSDSYVHGVNYILSDMAASYNNNFFDAEGERCYLFKRNAEKNFLDNSIVCTFLSYDFPRNLFNDCNNLKIIRMSEGGVSQLKDDNNEKFISSGIGENLLGLHNSFSNLQLIENKEDIVKILKEKITFIDQDDFNITSTYHYAYIGQLDVKFDNQFTKYFFDNFLLFNMIKNDSTEYLFSSYGITKNQILGKKPQLLDIFGSNVSPTSGNFKDNLLFFFSFLNITETSSPIRIVFHENNNYDIEDLSTRKKLKVRYFQRLDKVNFLSMIKFSTSPVFSTGDLSTQEALILGKYVIHDYIGNKQRFIISFNHSLVHYINVTRNPPFDNEEENINSFYDLLAKIEDSLNTNFNLGSKQDKSINTLFLNSLEFFNTCVKYYPCYKREIIDKIYDMDKNFIVLLTIINLYQQLKLFLPSQGNFDSGSAQVDIDVLLNTLWSESKGNSKLEQRPQGNRNGGGSSTYLQKYLKYKNKYLQLKNKLNK